MMLIDFGQYVNLIQGLCYLNLFIGFELDFICDLQNQVPTNETVNCKVVRILPINLNNPSKDCDSKGLHEKAVYRNMCIKYHCPQRKKRSTRNTEMEEQNGDIETLVLSQAFGNPSIPRKFPRKRKRKPPRRDGK